MVNKTKFSSYKINDLVKGCKYCVLGEKSVLFITGLCKRNCFYCPLPESRKNIDAVWINERKLSNVNAIKEAIEEIQLCGSKGVGITGGDPLIVLERTVKFVKTLKKKFGKKFHIHIYLPTEQLTREKLERLAASGIDEIRFHPNFLNFSEDERRKLDLALDLKKKYGWKVGVEIPVLPGTEKPLIDFIKQIPDLDFLNLNELEMAMINIPILYNKGFRTVENSNAVKGSNETALKVLNSIGKTKLLVHYCTARTKDAFQYCNRLKRRLKNAKKPYDLITEDNDLYRGAIYSEIKPGFGYKKRLESILCNKKGSQIIRGLTSLRKELIAQYKIPSNLIEIDKERLRILTSVEVVEELKDEIKKFNMNFRMLKMRSHFDIKKKGFYPALVTEIPAYDLPILQLEWL